MQERLAALEAQHAHGHPAPAPSPAAEPVDPPNHDDAAQALRDAFPVASEDTYHQREDGTWWNAATGEITDTPG